MPQRVAKRRLVSELRSEFSERPTLHWESIALRSTLSRIARRENTTQSSRGSLRRCRPRCQADLVCGVASVRRTDGDFYSLVGIRSRRYRLFGLFDRDCTYNVPSMCEETGAAGTGPGGRSKKATVAPAEYSVSILRPYTGRADPEGRKTPC